MKAHALAVVVVLACAGPAAAQQPPLRPGSRLIPNTPTPIRSVTPTPTPTPSATPDPCAACLDPASYWCQMYPDACAQCWTDCGRPIGTPTRTPTRTRTPAPSPTPTPIGQVPPCTWIQTPWGGSACDVRTACAFTLAPMHIGTPKPVPVRLNTDKTTREVWSSIPESGAFTLNISWPSSLKFAEWFIDHQPVPIKACYCDERRNVIVICSSGTYSHEVTP